MSMPLPKNVTPLHTEGYAELLSYCQALEKPYNEHEIRAFNAIYRCVYPQLSREEKRRTEALVDTLLEDLEEPRLASLIFGVF